MPTDRVPGSPDPGSPAGVCFGRDGAAVRRDRDSRAIGFSYPPETTDSSCTPTSPVETRSRGAALGVRGDCHDSVVLSNPTRRASLLPPATMRHAGWATCSGAEPPVSSLLFGPNGQHPRVELLRRQFWCRCGEPRATSCSCRSLLQEKPVQFGACGLISAERFADISPHGSVRVEERGEAAAIPFPGGAVASVHWVLPCHGPSSPPVRLQCGECTACPKGTVGTAC